eukprot:1115298-Prorocentrum_lima.AAC.1
MARTQRSDTLCGPACLGPLSRRVASPGRTRHQKGLVRDIDVESAGSHRNGIHENMAEVYSYHGQGGPRPTLHALPLLRCGTLQIDEVQSARLEHLLPRLDRPNAVEAQRP